MQTDRVFCTTIAIMVTVFTTLAVAVPRATAQSPSAPAKSAATLDNLKDTVELLLRRERSRQRELTALREKLNQLQATTASASKQATESQMTTLKNDGDVFASKIGDTVMRLKSIGIDVAAVGGYSSEREATTRALQAGGGGHDPDKTGFTLQAADFSMIGSVDGYVDGELHIAYVLDQNGASAVELEEAFLRTNSLPYGLELEAGQQFLEFGAFNPRHIHDWAFIDQPVINTRMFGGDGIRQTGLRAGWRIPDTPLEFHLGSYNARGETMKSFYAADEAIGGVGFVSQDVSGLSDLVYLGRIAVNTDLGSDSRIKLGASGLTGPNASGSSGETQIAGVDLTLHSSFSGGRSLLWQTEAMYRKYDLDQTSGVRGTTLKDYGLYTQFIFGFLPKWSTGVRVDYASGSGNGATAKDADDDRSDRYRVSPMIRWAFAPKADVRLQYNYDNMESLDIAGNDGEAHAVWLGLRFGFGAGGEFSGTHDHQTGHNHDH